MTNKYLLKIAAGQDEKDAGKTFLKSTAGGWAGHIGGGIIGGVAAATLASKNKNFGRIARKAVVAGKTAYNKVTSFGPGKIMKENFGKLKPGPGVSREAIKNRKGVTAAGVAGAVLAGSVAEEGFNYAATRHGVLSAKQNARNEQTKQAEEMTNRYLEKIAKTMDEKDRKLNRNAWGALGRGIGGSVAGSVAGGVTGAGIGAGVGALTSLASRGRLKLRDGASAGAIVGGYAGSQVGSLKGAQMGIRSKLRKMQSEKK